MEMKVLITYEWHYGIPDGDEKVSILFDDFDIEKEQEASFVVKNCLLQYGVNPDEITYKRRNYNNDYIFECEIGRFDKQHPQVRLYTQLCEVTASLEYVAVHRGKIYKFENLTVDTPIIEL